MATLHESVRSQHRLQHLIDAYRAGVSLDTPDDTRATPLHHALRATLGSVVIPTPAYALLALGAAPDLPDTSGVRPLHLAVQGAKADAVWLLLVLGADRHRPDAAGQTPADRLPPEALGRRPVAHLLEQGPGPRPQRSLIEAAQRDSAQAAYLLRQGADLDVRDAEGRTALHVCDSTAIVAALLALGADPSAQDARGRTPLHRACQGLGGEIELLLDGGADPGLRDSAGCLPIDGLHAQDYAMDFYDGDRLEGRRRDLIARLTTA